MVPVSTPIRCATQSADGRSRTAGEIPVPPRRAARDPARRSPNRRRASSARARCVAFAVDRPDSAVRSGGAPTDQCRLKPAAVPGTGRSCRRRARSGGYGAFDATRWLKYACRRFLRRHLDRLTNRCAHLPDRDIASPGLAFARLPPASASIGTVGGSGDTNDPDHAARTFRPCLISSSKGDPMAPA